MTLAKPFLSDNAAPVHPRLWEAMRKADEPDNPYDGDALSAELDARFTALFGRECAALWVATGTAANCLALATMCAPHGGVVCHREAHIEVDEGGAPGFFLHGAKLMLAEGEGAKLTPEGIAALIDPIRNDVHQVQPHAVAITQASEYGRAYTPAELAALGAFAKERRLGLHMDGARFANAAAFLGGSPEAAPLTEAELRICAELAPALRQEGLFFVGIDVIDGRLSEINVTSPTCIREIEAAFPISITGMLFDEIEQLLAARQ